MLKLTYTRKSDQYQTVTVLGHPDGIRDLYWQLTRNYQCQDGTEIGTVKVTNLDGYDCTDHVLSHPFNDATSIYMIES